MKPLYYINIFLFLALLAAGCGENGREKEQHFAAKASFTPNQGFHTSRTDTVKDAENGNENEYEYEVVKTEAEWKELLTFREYRVLRGRGTEVPFVNEYYDKKEEGVYFCGACGQPVFTSETKYESGTGWPSFWRPVKPSAVGEKEDNGLFMTRTETVCSRCGSHLGHVFEDGPEPTGLRYCLNSQALDFEAMDLSSVDVQELPPKEKKKL